MKKRQIKVQRNRKTEIFKIKSKYFKITSKSAYHQPNSIYTYLFCFKVALRGHFSCVRLFATL